MHVFNSWNDKKIGDDSDMEFSFLIVILGCTAQQGVFCNFDEV